VLAASLRRDNLQAHLTLARVGEQPPSSTPTSLPVRTISTTGRASAPRPPPPFPKSSIPQAGRRRGGVPGCRRSRRIHGLAGRVRSSERRRHDAYAAPRRRRARAIRAAVPSPARAAVPDRANAALPELVHLGSRAADRHGVRSAEKATAGDACSPGGRRLTVTPGALSLGRERDTAVAALDGVFCFEREPLARVSDSLLVDGVQAAGRRPAEQHLASARDVR
jgi:hypothetical protein